MKTLLAVSALSLVGGCGEPPNPPNYTCEAVAADACKDPASKQCNIASAVARALNVGGEDILARATEAFQQCSGADVSDPANVCAPLHGPEMSNIWDGDCRVDEGSN